LPPNADGVDCAVFGPNDTTPVPIRRKPATAAMVIRTITPVIIKGAGDWPRVTVLDVADCGWKAKGVCW
jgi:hypothetical protein